MAKRLTVLSSSLVFVGVWAIILSVFWNLVNYEDEGPRCTIAACSQSALNWYWFVAEASTAIAVVGAAVVVLGLWLGFRRPTLPTVKLRFQSLLKVSQRLIVKYQVRSLKIVKSTLGVTH